MVPLVCLHAGLKAGRGRQQWNSKTSRMAVDGELKAASCSIRVVASKSL